MTLTAKVKTMMTITTTTTTTTGWVGMTSFGGRQILLLQLANKAVDFLILVVIVSTHVPSIGKEDVVGPVQLDRFRVVVDRRCVLLRGECLVPQPAHVRGKNRATATTNEARGRKKRVWKSVRLCEQACCRDSFPGDRERPIRTGPSAAAEAVSDQHCNKAPERLWYSLFVVVG